MDERGTRSSRGGGNGSRDSSSGSTTGWVFGWAWTRVPGRAGSTVEVGGGSRRSARSRTSYRPILQSPGRATGATLSRAAPDGAASVRRQISGVGDSPGPGGCSTEAQAPSVRGSRVTGRLRYGSDYRSRLADLWSDSLERARGPRWQAALAGFTAEEKAYLGTWIDEGYVLLPGADRPTRSTSRRGPSNGLERDGRREVPRRVPGGRRRPPIPASAAVQGRVRAKLLEPARQFESAPRAGLPKNKTKRGVRI
jgi:hypothetical protein